jgi:cytochrome c oxidase subunit II
MRANRSSLTQTLCAAMLFLLAAPAVAAPVPWEMNLQPAVTPIAERVRSFHDLLLWIITLIALFVLALLAYVAYRFNEKRNPVPSKRSHNTLLEVVWTAVPVLILVIIAIPSFKLLYFSRVTPPADLTIKAIGHQWNWSYVYPDNGNFTFDSLLVQDSDLKPGQLRLLETDNHVVLPAGKIVRVLVTGSDVIHSWALPAAGVKVDAIPGRLNELWVQIAEPGTYYGQCSELCGAGHGFMPITVDVVPPEQFDAWVKQAQQKFAKASDGFEVAAAKLPAVPAN